MPIAHRLLAEHDITVGQLRRDKLLELFRSNGHMNETMEVSAMEAGKWIVFAFLLGCVLVGFKTRQLKWYEFAVSGLFLVLLDGLVFHGEISRWVGQLGSNLKGAATHAGSMGHAAVGLGLLDPATRARIKRLGRRVWANRPAPIDYVLVLAATFLAAVWLEVAVPVGLVLFSAALAVAVLLAAGFDHDEQDQDNQQESTPGGSDG